MNLYAEKPFVHLFKTEKSNYCYDVNSNEILKLDEHVYDVLMLLQSGLDDNDIIKYLSNQYPKDQIIDTLKTVTNFQQKDYFFSSNHPDEISYLPNKKDYENIFNYHIEQLTLEITEKCNLRCKYCIHSGLYPKERIHSNKEMSWEIAKKALDYMLEHGGHQKNPYIERFECDRDFTIGFYGGEPLLRLDFIKKCKNYIDENLSDGRNCNFTLTTNGTLLTYDNIEYLLGNNFSIGISLDGPDYIHNRCRIFENGTYTHDTIIKGIENISRYTSKAKPEIPFLLILQVTVTGKTSYVDLLEYFVELEPLLNTKYVKFTLLFTPLSVGYNISDLDDVAEYFEHPRDFDIVFKEYVEACKNHVYKKVNTAWRYRVLNSMVKNSCYFNVYTRTYYQHENEIKLNKRRHPGSICLLGCRRSFVKVDGTIFPCERVPSEESIFQIGNVDGGIDIDKVIELMECFTNLTSEDCKKCWIQRICNVGCLRDVLKNGLPDKDMKLNKCTYGRLARARELREMCILLEESPTALSHYDDIKIS